MSTQIRPGFSARTAVRPTRGRDTNVFERVRERLARSLWLQDRGLGELRWASITLATMAMLGASATWLQPGRGSFERVVILSTPLAIVLGVLGWSRAGSRIGRISSVRLLLGPMVVLVTILGTGLADAATLQRPPSAPLIALAMAFAALTPGYSIAAALISGGSLAVLVAHAQIVGFTGQSSGVSDEFMVGFIVTLLASAGLAFVVRVATESEDRATRLSAQNRERMAVLERVNGIVARFDGSQPVREVIQAVVDDIAHEFDIALVSMYLPLGRDRLSMVGVAGYSTPFHEIEIGLGIIGRAAATGEVQFVPDVRVDPDYRAAREDVRSEVAAPVVHDGELLGVVNLEGTAEHPIGPTQVALAGLVVRALSAALRSARLDDERRDRLHAIESVLAVSRSLVAGIGRASSTRSSRPWPSCSRPTSWPSSRGAPTGRIASRRAPGSRPGRSISRSTAGGGWSVEPSSNGSGSTASRR